MFSLLNYNKETNAKVEFIAKVFTGIQTILSTAAFSANFPIVGWVCFALGLLAFIGPIFVGPDNPFLKNRPENDTEKHKINSGDLSGVSINVPGDETDYSVPPTYSV